MPDIFSPPDAQSQFDSAGSGGEGAGTMPPPAPPKPPGPAGESTPPVIPTIDPRPPLSSMVDHPPPADARILDLELQVFDLQQTVVDLREEVANLARIASMAYDEGQQALLRIDQVEHEWRAWGDGVPEGDLGVLPQPEPVTVSLSPTAPSPQNLSPRTQEAQLQRPLLQLEDDPLVQWYNSSGTPGIDSSALTHAPPQAVQRPRSLSPLGGNGQLSAAGVAWASAPPGIEQPAADHHRAWTAATSPAGDWAGSQALLRPDDHEGQRGGASLVSLAVTDPRPPHASLGSLGDGSTPVAPSVKQERDHRIFSFLAGPQFGWPALPRGSAGGTPSLMGPYVAAPATEGSPFHNCGAAPELPRAPAPGGPPQTGNAGPEASGSGPSMAELNMVLKTLTLTGEFPKLEPGDPATRARRFEQWLRQVTQSLEPTGPVVASWWQWARNSAEAAHRTFLATALDLRESVLPQGDVPTQHTMIESWMRPRILACLPKDIKEWVELRAQAGTPDPSHLLVYYI